MSIHGPLSSIPATLESAIDSACATIAPSWPLDRQIAVNPWWGFVHRPFAQVACELDQVSGARLTFPARTRGQNAAQREGLPLPSDVLDGDPHRPRGPFWREAITQQVSQYCASFFDRHQSDWHRPGGQGLYLGWRDALPADHALETLMRAPQVRENAALLPRTPQAAIAWALERLQVEPSQVATFLQACLWRIGGWASWCAFLAWEARLHGRQDDTLRQLLAIRVCWEALLPADSHTGYGRAAWRQRWHEAQHRPDALQPLAGLALQRERETAWQDELVRLLASTHHAGAPSVADTVLVFCIDVRSERLRRALEAVDESLSTRGFAGFFGMPMAFSPLGVDDWQPRLPGLLAPTIRATETSGDAQVDGRIIERRHQQLRSGLSRRTFPATPTGSFACIETLGLARIAQLLGQSFGFGTARNEAGLADQRDDLQPCLVHTDVTQGATLAASALRAMGLTRLPRLLVLVGHGSQSTNNPQAASLDCGACGGHGGETNAGLLAGLLNDPAVRALLPGMGIDVPADMRVVAARHNTTTDEIELLGCTGEASLRRLRESLGRAGDLARAERAADLGLAGLTSSPERLLLALQRRARLVSDPARMGTGRQCRIHRCAALAHARAGSGGARVPARLQRHR